MPQDGRDPARNLGIQRSIEWWERARRAGSTLRRRSRGLRLLPGIDQLETRRMLSLSAVTGPMAAPSPSTAPAQESFNLQLQPGSPLALSQLMPLITAEGATIATTPIASGMLKPKCGPLTGFDDARSDWNLSANPA